MEPDWWRFAEYVTTEDGTTTVGRKDLGVTYRSMAGAQGESRFVFIEASDFPRGRNAWHVLELGFGLGTNFRMMREAAMHAGVVLNYTAVENAPVPPKLFTHADFADDDLHQLFVEVHESGEMQQMLREGITLSLYPAEWKDEKLSDLKVDAVFHDPFGPDANPDCWTRETFEWAKSHMKTDAVLLTYGAAGHVRRAMRDAGFFVASAPGYGPKREMALAALQEERLASHRIRYRPS